MLVPGSCNSLPLPGNCNSFLMPWRCNSGKCIFLSWVVTVTSRSSPCLWGVAQCLCQRGAVSSACVGILERFNSLVVPYAAEVPNSVLVPVRCNALLVTGRLSPCMYQGFSYSYTQISMFTLIIVTSVEDN